MAVTQGSVAGKASHGLRLALIRPVLDGEPLPLTALQQDVQKSFEANSQDATSLIKSNQLASRHRTA